MELDALKTIPAKSENVVVPTKVERIDAPKNVKKETTASTSNKEKKEIASLRKDIAALALKYKGTPYRYGGKTPKGFDCSGFTHYVMTKMACCCKVAPVNKPNRAKK
ncbi:MAG: C40 family peptidase [Saprospiraceae bacterium]|nr:C40 family peptidase [Saprospiraceae bacterium]